MFVVVNHHWIKVSYFLPSIYSTTQKERTYPHIIVIVFFFSIRNLKKPHHPLITTLQGPVVFVIFCYQQYMAYNNTTPQPPQHTRGRRLRRVFSAVPLRSSSGGYLRSTFAEIEQSKLSKTQMSAAAAAAALARQDANKMSVGELKKKFQDRNINTSHCIEKADLVALYVRTIGKEEHMKDVKNRPKAKATENYATCYFF